MTGKEPFQRTRLDPYTPFTGNCSPASPGEWDTYSEQNPTGQWVNLRDASRYQPWQLSMGEVLFQPQDFDSWMIRTQAHARSRGLEALLDNSIPRPKPGTPIGNRWAEVSSMVAAWMTLTVDIRIIKSMKVRKKPFYFADEFIGSLKEQCQIKKPAHTHRDEISPLAQWRRDMALAELRNKQHQQIAPLYHLPPPPLP